MKITEQMTVELNNELAKRGCPFRYSYYAPGYTGNSHIQITLPSMNYVDSFIINPTKEFFNWIEAWFNEKGIKLGCNADGSILWSATGWDED